MSNRPGSSASGAHRLDLRRCYGAFGGGHRVFEQHSYRHRADAARHRRDVRGFPLHAVEIDIADQLAADKIDPAGEVIVRLVTLLRQDVKLRLLGTAALRSLTG
jgi:hypothetical protein